MSERMSDTAFQIALDNEDDYAIAMEARRAREAEEIEARRANGAELLVDAKEAELKAAREEIAELKNKSAYVRGYQDGKLRKAITP
jgi:hypothetical protein